MEAIFGLFFVLFIFAGIAAAYFVPVIVAISRKHHQILAIFVLNLLLGWTILGWAGALVWACIKPQTNPSASTTQQNGGTVEG